MRFVPMNRFGNLVGLLRRPTPSNRCALAARLDSSTNVAWLSAVTVGRAEAFSVLLCLCG